MVKIGNAEHIGGLDEVSLAQSLHFSNDGMVDPNPRKDMVTPKQPTIGEVIKVKKLMSPMPKDIGTIGNWSKNRPLAKGMK